MIFCVDPILLGVDAVLVLSQGSSQRLSQIRWIILCRLAPGNRVDGVKSFQRLMEEMSLLPLPRRPNSL
jgi:hypothetical protein